MIYYFILSGFVALFVSVIGGYAFAKAIKSTPDREVAWRVVHSGGSMAGIMLMVLGCAWQYIHLGSYEYLIGCLLIVSTYLLLIAMFIAAITGKRGLHSNETGVAKVVYFLYAVGAVLCTVSMTGILIGLLFQ
jgi:hypothetical protein